MVLHLLAYSETYAEDAKAWKNKGSTETSKYCLGKADAFLTAATWINESMEG